MHDGCHCIARILIASVLLSVAVSGCVVIPHPRDVVQLSPVAGRVVRSDVPLAGITLTMNAVNNTSSCAEPVAEVTTDDEGRFAFREFTRRAYWRQVVLAPSSPTYSVTLCVSDRSGTRPVFSRRIWATLPTRLVLDCDLDRHESDRTCDVADWSGYNYIVGDAGYQQCRPPTASDDAALSADVRAICDRDK